MYSDNKLTKKGKKIKGKKTLFCSFKLQMATAFTSIRGEASISHLNFVPSLSFSLLSSHSILYLPPLLLTLTLFLISIVFSFNILGLLDLRFPTCGEALYSFPTKHKNPFDFWIGYRDFRDGSVQYQTWVFFSFFVFGLVLCPYLFESLMGSFWERFSCVN